MYETTGEIIAEEGPPHPTQTPNHHRPYTQNYDMSITRPVTMAG
jgi:hypothetical protein